MAARTVRRAKVFAPASIANLGPGFDTLGVALEGLGDVIEAERTTARGVRLALAAPVAGLPARMSDNAAAVVARAVLSATGARFGVRLMLDKRLPVGSGLGSSAASGVAAAVAVNALLAHPLDTGELLRFAVEGERYVSGAAHADNAAPSLFGGVCLVRGAGADGVLRLPAGDGLVWVVAHPALRLDTARARRVLPRAVPLARAVRQWANVGGLVAGVLAGDLGLIGACMEDVVVEPARARLIPGFAGVKRAALAAGAAGCSIAGSGPSVFAVTDDLERAAAIAHAMRAAFARAGLVADTHVARTGASGARVLRRWRA